MTKVATKTKSSSLKTIAPKAEVKTSRADVQNILEYTKFVPKIEKRNGDIVPFDFEKITSALHKSMLASGEGSEEEARMVAHKVAADIVRIARKYRNFLPTVEGLQDTVEKELILSDYVVTSKAYIIYRNDRAKLREEGIEVPEHIKKLAEESANYFKDNRLGEFVYLRTYARWIPEEGRREMWVETIDRYLAFMKENLGSKLTTKEYAEIRDTMLKQEALPSMRLLQFSGDPARRCNTVGYNCSFIAPTKLQDFGEILYLSACGVGVGFAVESQNVQQLPQVQPQNGKKIVTYTIRDSKEGWADALVWGLKTWYNGRDVDFDYSKIRRAGTRLKTMGGKASGPDPLRSLLAFSREVILKRQGKRLSNLDVHDIICKIGEAIVSGGVRRTAMISLSDLDDNDMRHAKEGQFYLTNPQRSMANNSAVYADKPTNTELMDEWVALMKAGSGERGIFNRAALVEQLPSRRREYWEKIGLIQNGRITKPVGTNPCGEIILQSKQFCNLSEVIARSTDTPATLKRKVRIATILGTYQSSLINFNYLSKEWKENCEAERLLGVSITGQWDSKAMRDEKTLRMLRKEAIVVNKKYAKRFGINPSTSITTVKPSGTTSQTVNCSSGMHARHAPFYIRRVRISATDSLFKMMRDQGAPFHPEVGQTIENATTFVLEFPVRSPKSSTYKNDLSALDQLAYWKLVKENYTEHNPSVTVSVGENEWIEVVNWLYKNWSILGGLSFLPRSGHVYQLAPYEEISQKEYDELLKRFTHIDYSKLITYELKDETEMQRELACVGGLCEID